MVKSEINIAETESIQNPETGKKPEKLPKFGIFLVNPEDLTTLIQLHI